MTTKKTAVAKSDEAEAAIAGDTSLADRLSSLMVSVRTTQATGAFTEEQESEWMAIDAELRGVEPETATGDRAEE